MTPSGQTICLCMIVKDEAPVIRRCLDSVRPLIDRWLIVDTGSTDGTQTIVREHLSDVPGELVERPWRDFAFNRSEALALARERGDYSLIIDADDALVLPDGFALPSLDADSYTVDIDFNGVRYNRPQLVKAALGWRYEGVIHEYLACEAAKTTGHLPIVLRIHQDGARRRDPDTYKKDAAVLERAVAEETDPLKLARYTFYLAQSYRDSGQAEKSVALYLRRADMGFWDQEVFCSLLYAGRQMLALGRDPDEVLAVYRRATAACPTRAEALHAAARLCRSRSRFAEGRVLARQGAELAQPPGGLFVEAWIYDFGALDEWAVNAYWAGHHRDCLDATLKALKRGKVPAGEMGRCLDNMRFALDKMPEDVALVPAGPAPGQIPNLSTKHGPKSAPVETRTKKPHVHICHVSINAHDRIFDSTILTLKNALEDAGCFVSLTKNHIEPDYCNIIIGSIIFAAQTGALSFLNGSQYIVYQLEQLSSKGGLIASHPTYLNILSHADIILEYSPSGMAYLEEIGLGNKVRHLPQTFHPSMVTIEPAAEHDIDVLFVGSGTDRRQEILRRLRQRGLVVEHAFGVYGKELDIITARAKIVLNIHAWDEIDILETVRLSFLIANKCFIVSERGDHDPFDSTITYADYDDLPNVCVDWLKKGRAARDDVSLRAYNRYLQTDFRTDVRVALGSTLERQPRLVESVGTNPSQKEVANSISNSSSIYNTKQNRDASMPSMSTFIKPYNIEQGHTGIDYLVFLKRISDVLRPRSYLEIGTNTGESLQQFECDALCIDPNFIINRDAISNRRRTFFFQMKSDDFFQDHDALTYLNKGIGIAFLDGLHHFEVTLRDFINVERSCHARSTIIIHDCLPITTPMTTRTFSGGMWTGDVWRLLPILKKYRPELRISCLDCPPTGLVICTGLDPKSTALSDNYFSIIDEFMNKPMNKDLLQSVGEIYPYFDTAKIITRPDDISLIFG